MKKVILSLILIIWLFCFTACTNNKDYVEISEYQELNVHELQKSYIENEVAAKENFSGKYLYFTGEIHRIEEGMSDNEIIFRYRYAYDDSKQMEFDAHFSKDYDKIKELKIGDTITVYCKFYDRMIDNYAGVTSSYSFKSCQLNI